MVADLSDLSSAISKATFVVTGEGSFDSQSGRGKLVSYVQRVAADRRVPVGLIAGRVSHDANTSPFAEVVSMVDMAGSRDAAMSDPARWLRQAGCLMASRLT
jgi:glycerate kinase